MTFEHPEDHAFFVNLLCASGETIDRYSILFDFRSPSVKRNEFNRKRAKLIPQLKRLYGTACMLRFMRACTGGAGALTVDHILPLSSNKLNKELRRLAPLSGKKVITQSIGSNHIVNLVLACGPCNGAKKHRFLGARETQRLLALTSRVLDGTQGEPA